MKYNKIASCLLFLTTPCFANSSDITENVNILSDEVDPYFNIILGVSPFLGFLGFEYQSGNNAYGVGLPGHLSYRYYYKPYQDTKFWGMYLGSYSLDGSDNNKTYSHEGINYSNVDHSYVGVGIGYRWQWSSGWNTSASIALEYSDEDYSNPATGQTATDTGVIPFPGLNIGYKF